MLDFRTNQECLVTTEHDLKDNTILSLFVAHVSLRENLIQFQATKSINPGFYYSAMADTFFALISLALKSRSVMI